MADIFALAAGDLLSPMVLCFALGVFAGVVRSDLEIPQAIARALSIYLMFAIGFKGGVGLNESGFGGGAGLGMLAALGLSFAMPFLAFGLLRLMTGLDRTLAAAISAHYGSISVVTFVTASTFLTERQVPYEGYIVAMMALMETPAILSGLALARTGVAPGAARKRLDPEVLREVLVNGSVVLLVGGFLIGWITGARGMTMIGPFVKEPFNGLLCLFLLDMGLLAARQSAVLKLLRPPVLAFGLLMPLVGAGLGLGVAVLLGLGLGGTTLMMVLAASASYIAVPAAMRMALPEANPAVYVTLSLAVTFPFNVVVGIPAYFWLASQIAS